jgi:hypothetical protein
MFADKETFSQDGNKKPSPSSLFSRGGEGFQGGAGVIVKV